MILVGLTGGIACGKSLVARFLGELSIPVIDADRLAHEALSPGTPAHCWLHQFHPDCLDEHGVVDRSKLGAIVFSRGEERRHLESLIHPYVKRRIVIQLVWYWLCGHDRVVLDIPLLCETGLDKFMSVVLVVACPEPLQIKRIQKRNQLDEEEAKQRIAAQMPLADKINRAHLVIHNDGSVASLHDQVMRVARLTKPDPLVHVLGYWLTPLLSGVLLLYLLIKKCL